MDRLALARPRVSDSVSAWKRWASGVCSQQICALQKKLDKERSNLFGRKDGSFHELFYWKRKKFYELLQGREKKDGNWVVRDPHSGDIVQDPEKIKEVVNDVCSRRLRLRVEAPLPFSGITPMEVTDVPRLASKPPPVPRRGHMRNQPSWWKKMYARTAKGIQSDVWKGLMSPCSEEEVLCLIREAEPHKAAGYDGLSIDLLKILVSSPKYVNTLKALTFLVNFALRHGPLLSWKRVVITLIPKAENSENPEDLRPISVLPELSKLCSRILANRIGEIIKDNPSIMSEAQRGFLRNGSVLQCINAALDVFEDAKENKRLLYATSYDFEKAYDSVQLFSIVASLERFNAPKQFVDFVTKGLVNAYSRFRTPFGMTEPFQILSSVRQGDPLAPLLFIMVVDALHEGLQENPLFSVRTGYCLQDSDVVVGSLGYADDTLVLTEDWRSMWQAHTWVREFCRAHNLTINSRKTKLFGRDWKGDEDPRCLWPVQGDRFDAKSGTFPLDYAQQRIVQKEKMNAIIFAHLRRMRVNRLQAHEKVTMTKELIMSQLDAGLQVADISYLVLRKWNSAYAWNCQWTQMEHSVFPESSGC